MLLKLVVIVAVAVAVAAAVAVAVAAAVVVVAAAAVVVVVQSRNLFQVVAIAKLHSACQQRWSTEQLPLVPAKQAIRQISQVNFCSSYRQETRVTSF